MFKKLIIAVVCGEGDMVAGRQWSGRTVLLDTVEHLIFEPGRNLNLKVFLSKK